eukprot:gene16549-18225_t
MSEEGLKKINYSSSDDDFVCDSDTGSIQRVNLERRISKMDRNQERHTHKKQTRKSSRNKKEKAKEIENKKECEQILSDCKKTTINNGFITTKRLTTPLVEISKHLKDSFPLRKLYPGKRYLQEIKDELRKIYRQKYSLLNDSFDKPSQHLQEHKVLPIRVSSAKYTRSLLRLSHEEERTEEKTVPQYIGIGNNKTVRDKQLATQPVTSNQPVAEEHCIQPNIFYEGDPVMLSRNGEDNAAEHSHAFQIISSVTESVGYKSCDLNQATHVTQSALLPSKDCAVAVQRVPYSTSQMPQPQLNSGTCSQESSVRDKSAMTADCNSIVNDNDVILQGAFRPRRQGNKSSNLEMIHGNDVHRQEMRQYTEHRDHDYHMASPNKCDILDYAGIMECKKEGGSGGEDRTLAKTNAVFLYIVYCGSETIWFTQSGSSGIREGGNTINFDMKLKKLVKLVSWQF